MWNEALDRSNRNVRNCLQTCFRFNVGRYHKAVRGIIVAMLKASFETAQHPRFALDTDIWTCPHTKNAYSSLNLHCLDDDWAKVVYCLSVGIFKAGAYTRPLSAHLRRF